MSQFVVTNAGLAAAAAASPTGPFVNITQFKLGDNYTTAPLVTDTGLAGSTVYTGTPASFSFYDSQTIQINLEIPATAGPFDYGEVGIYMPSNVLFARMSFGALRTKSDSSVAGYANTLRIKCLLRLSQGPAVFNFSPNTSQTVLELVSFQVLQTPNDNPANPVVIVHEPNDYQESVVLFKDSATLWNICNYTKIGVASVTAAPSSNEVTASFFGTLYTPASSRGRYVIQTSGGYIRQINTIAGSVATLSSSFATAGLVGQTVSVYQSDLSRIGEIYSSVATLQSQMASMVFYLGNATLSGSDFSVSAGAFPPVGLVGVKFLSSNPSAATLNINGSGAKPLLDQFGSALPSGSIVAGETKYVFHTGTNYVVEDSTTYLQNKNFVGSGNQLLGTSTTTYPLGTTGVTSFGTSGYQKLPGGLMIQTGTLVCGDIGGGTLTQATTFPIPFTTKVWVPPTFTMRDGNNQFTIIQGFDNLTLTGFDWKFYEIGSSAQNVTLYYSVIGQ